jgi:hypothetical protein
MPHPVFAVDLMLLPSDRPWLDAMQAAKDEQRPSLMRDFLATVPVGKHTQRCLEVALDQGALSAVHQVLATPGVSEHLDDHAVMMALIKGQDEVVDRLWPCVPLTDPLVLAVLLQPTPSTQKVRPLPLARVEQLLALSTLDVNAHAGLALYQALGHPQVNDGLIRRLVARTTIGPMVALMLDDTIQKPTHQKDMLARLDRLTPHVSETLAQPWVAQFGEQHFPRWRARRRSQDAETVAPERPRARRRT